MNQKFRGEATPSEPEMVFEVIGLVGDTKYRDIRKGFEPTAHLATSQDTRFTNWWVQVLIRSNVPIPALTSRVRQDIAEMDPEIATEFQMFNATIRDGLLRERLLATLSGFFGLLAALLATLGLYGVMSYLVVRRTNEIGIRMTLGADGREIVAMVMREAACLLGLGFGAGLALSLICGRAARASLFGSQPHDLLTLTADSLLQAAAAWGASYVPA